MPLKTTKPKSSYLLFASIFLIVIIGGFSVLKKDNVESPVSQNENEDSVVVDSQFSVSIDGSEVALNNPEVSNAEEKVLSVPTSMDVFSKCLTDKGAKLYGASWCPHCQSQKKAFGESVQYINYIECADDKTKTQTPACQLAGIKAYPTWQFSDGSEIVGQVTFEDLSKKTGCSL